MEIQNVKLTKIKPYAKNPRNNDGAVDAVAASIEQFGFQQPIVVDKDNIIIVGHTRYKAAKKLGLKEVPVVIADGLTEEQVKAYRIADNSTNTLASWDFDLLADELADIPNIDLGEFGLDITMAGEDGEVGMEDIIEDEPPEVNLEEEATVKRGEVYRLGDHVLMCGDATDSRDVERLADGTLADMIFTDPPYNVSLGTKNKTLNALNGTRSIERPIIGDGDDGQTDEEVGRSLWLPAFTNLFDNAKDDQSIYVTMPQGGTHMMMMMMMIHEAGWQVKHELMWLKNVPTFSMNRLDYDYQHEPIMYGWKKTHKWVGGGEHQKSVWPINRLQKCDLHPTMKPQELICNAILNSSDKGDTVLDVFGGSGSTLMACEQTGRKCLMMELDPHYCDVIIKRWEDYTGKRQELIA